VFTPQVDPKASEIAGYTVYMFPPNITEVDPPSLTGTQRAYFIDGAWVIGNEIDVYTKTNVAAAPITVPEREYDTDMYTPLVPPNTNPRYCTWDGSAWVYDAVLEKQDLEDAVINTLIYDKIKEQTEANARAELETESKIYTVNADITNGSNIMVTKSGSPSVGHLITGTGIQKNTTVVSINGANLTMSQTATETATNRDFTFYYKTV
jgi:hypothetical protein